jgi:hypothetical protein
VADDDAGGAVAVHAIDDARTDRERMQLEPAALVERARAVEALAIEPRVVALEHAR